MDWELPDKVLASGYFEVSKKEYFLDVNDRLLCLLQRWQLRMGLVSSSPCLSCSSSSSSCSAAVLVHSFIEPR
ncbi:unnamed protein product [Gongylonema pulchrum]|uniref:Uncharacterized protein n=1 Tax=Gongylonema pulchrum TaxID=637853 RepID=A0A183E845_9BILA|nr:unnamed protein product [Gongylonema pulchrum]